MKISQKVILIILVIALYAITILAVSTLVDTANMGLHFN